MLMLRNSLLHLSMRYGLNKNTNANHQRLAIQACYLWLTNHNMCCNIMNKHSNAVVARSVAKLSNGFCFKYNTTRHYNCMSSS